MTRGKLVGIVVLTAVVSATVSAIATAQLDKILKGGGIALLVDKFGPDINKGINSLTGDKNLSVNQATKVVPVLSFGSGDYAGAVQVAGDRSVVEKVKAVAQLEGKLPIVGGVRLRALIPVAAKSVQDIKRVPGVGVSALVDVKL